MRKNPDKRLGASAADAEEIKQHPFFYPAMNWDDLLAKRTKPPFKPTVVRKSFVRLAIRKRFECKKIKNFFCNSFVNIVAAH